MIMTRKKAMAAIVLGLTVALVFFLLPDRERQVRKQLTRLSEYVAREPKEPMFTTVAKAMKIETLFARSLVVEVDNPSMTGRYRRKDVVDRINMARKSFSRLTITLHDMHISFPQEAQAEVLLTMRIIGQQGDKTYTDTRELEFTLDKSGKKWLISRIKTVEVLQR